MVLASGCRPFIGHSAIPIGLAAARHRGPVALASLLERADFLGRRGCLLPDRLELAPQCRELDLDRATPPLQLPTPAILLPPSHDRRGPLPGLLGHAHRA